MHCPRSRDRLGAILSAVLGFTTGCQTATEFLDSAGRPLADLPRVAYRVAVAPLDLGPYRDVNLNVVQASGSGSGSGSGTSTGALRLIVDRADPIRGELIAILQGMELRAATEIIAVANNGEALDRNADLFIQPRLKSPASIVADGWVFPNYVYSLGLWLTTWYFGTVLEDYSYKAEMAIDFDIIDPHTNLTLHTLEFRSSGFRLNMWDRSWLDSAGAYAGLLLPPGMNWLDGEASAVSAVVSKKIREQAAAELTRWLKEGLAPAQRAHLGDIVIEQPLNGALASAVGSSTRLRGEIISRVPISGFRVFVDERQQALPADYLSTPSRQRVGNEYRMPLPAVDLRLNPGAKQAIAIEVDFGLRRMTRTISVGSDKAGQR